MSALELDVILHNDQYRASLSQVERDTIGFTKKVESEGAKIDQTFKRLGQAAAGYFAFTQLADLPAQIIKVRGEFQQLEIAFTTMLRSKTAADALLKEIVQTAATTPFSLKDVGQGAKQLLAYGSSAKSVIGELRTLGDVAAGVSAPINDLIYLYGTLRTQGRAYAVDIRQFAGRGIPIYEELGKVLGVATDQVNKFVSEGKVGFAEVEQAFKNMTTEGGQFAGLMDAQSKSLTGLQERLGDAYDQMLNKVGQANEGILAAAITGATNVVENYEEILDVLKILVATYGAYRAVLIATTALQITSGVVANARAWLQLASTIRTAKDAQIAFNLATSANPIGLLAGVIAALATAYVVYSGNVSDAEKATQRLTAAQNETTVAVAEERAKIELLTREVKSGNLTYGEREKKLKELIALAPDILGGLTQETIATQKGAEAIDNYVASLEKKIRLEKLNSEFIESVRRETEGVQQASNLSLAQSFLVESEGDARRGPNATRQKIIKENEEAVRKTEKAIRDELLKQIDTIQKVDNADAEATGRKLDRHEAFLKSLKEAKEPIDLINLGGLARTEEEIEALSDRIKEAKASLDKDSKEYKKLQSTFDALNPKKAKAIPEKDKPQPFGSLAYYEQVSRKAQEILDKTPSSNSDLIRQKTFEKLEADKRAEELRKQYAVKTYVEELDEKRKQYEQYQRYIEFVGQTQADAQFSQLKESGSNYYDYITAEIARLEALRDQNKLSKEEGAGLIVLKADRDALTGAKSPIENFRESLQKAGEEAQSLTDYIQRLEDAQAGLAGNTTEFGFEARRETAEAIVEAKKQQKLLLRDFLQAVVGSEEQRLAITRKYQDLRVALEKSGTDKGSPAYLARLKAIDDAEKEEIKAVKSSVLQQTDEYKKLGKAIDVQGLQRIKEQIKRNEDFIRIAEEKNATETEDYKNALEERKRLKEDFDKTTIDIVRQFSQVGGELFGVLSQANGALGTTGQLLGGIAGQMNNVLNAFDETATDAERMQAGILGVVGLLDIIVSSANQRKQAEGEYYRSVLDQQQQYNLLLNEQIGLQSDVNGSIFLNDYLGRAADGYNKLTNAQEEYNKNLEKLAGGSAKNGQKNGVDLGAVGKGIGSGAAVGAAVASVIPVIGPLVGAVGGAIVGGLTALFAGKKKKDTFVGLLEAYPDLIKEAADGTQTLNEELAKSLLASNQLDESTKQIVEDTLEWQKAMEDARQQITDVVKDLAGGIGDGIRNNLVTAFEDGTDAAIAYGDAVENVLENIISNLLFNQLFAEDFKALQKRMEESLGGGDGNLVDDLVDFYQEGAIKAQQYTDSLKKAQEELAAQGIDIFQPNGGGTKADPNSLSGAVKSITEDTAGLLAGQINAIRINGADVLVQMRQMVLLQSEIAVNSRFNRHLETLTTIERHLREMKEADPLRASGGIGPK